MAGIDSPQEIQKVCARNGLRLSDEQIRLLARFVECVLEWNSKINLISRRDQENIWLSHVLHSLSLLFYVDLAEGSRLLDIGTGGGFPGIPISIARPDLGVVLLDSIRKKTHAVQDIVDRLGLTGISVRTGRAEEVDGKSGAGTFDIVVARAVAPLRDLVRWSRPYLKDSRATPWELTGKNRVKITGPALIALKGGDLEKEIVEAEIKERVRFIHTLRMSFNGSLEMHLEDKQAVIVGI
jgi:16S rRNA (guanine527-N7)-methyltransferase